MPRRNSNASNRRYEPTAEKAAQRLKEAAPAPEPAPAPAEVKPARKRGPAARFAGGLTRTTVALDESLAAVVAGYASAHGVTQSEALREAVCRLRDDLGRPPRKEALAKG